MIDDINRFYLFHPKVEMFFRGSINRYSYSFDYERTNDQKVSRTDTNPTR